jgi:cytochrome P450
MTQEGVDAFGEMIAYLEGLARERRSHTGEPEHPLDVLIRAEVEGARLSDELIGQHLILLLVGGTETFPKVFCSAVLRLAQYPDQRAELVAEPARVPQALRECLRYDTPTQFLMRSVKRDFELGGQQLKEGQSVMFLYPSANRDGREFEEPERFDIHRRSPRILSFGHGVHRCLGGHFAEMEGKVLLEEVLARFPDYRVDEKGIVHDRTEFIRGMAHLPIEF